MDFLFTYGFRQHTFGNFTLSKLEILCGVFPDDPQNDDALMINMVLSITRYHLYLMRNITKNEDKQISFTECYIRLRFYITSHVRLLTISKHTSIDVKCKLEELLNHIAQALRNGIHENSL